MTEDTHDQSEIPESHRSILLTIASVPAGKISTYGQIATLAGQPGKARFVGHILKNLPRDSRIPWHRIINAQGKSSFPVNSDRYQKQIALLEAEGIVIKNHKISLKQFLWPQS